MSDDTSPSEQVEELLEATDPTKDPAADSGAPVTPAKPKKERRPLGPHVFGKFGFFICVVPYIFYLAGNMFASYVENARGHSAIKEQIGYVAGPLEKVREKLEEDYGNIPGGFEKYWNGWNLEAIKSVISAEEEEEFTAEKLENLLDPINEVADPEFPAKIVLREQLKVLREMRELEEDHKVREVLAMSHRHFQRLKGEAIDDVEEETISNTASGTEWWPEAQTWYPTTYTIVIAGTAILMLLAFPGYFKAPFKITHWSVIVGVLGIVVWIALTELDRRFLHVGEMLAPGGRDAFNPFEELKSNQTWMWQFMAIRFTGLVLIVPFIEEFFLRGWLMRYIDDPDWDQMPLAEHGQLAVLGVVGFAVVAHLGEPLAAAAWFGMVTWLFLKTKSVWDCVVAHAITNLLLGLVVCYTGWWYYW